MKNVRLLIYPYQFILPIIPSSNIIFFHLVFVLQHADRLFQLCVTDTFSVPLYLDSINRCLSQVEGFLIIVETTITNTFWARHCCRNLTWIISFSSDNHYFVNEETTTEVKHQAQCTENSLLAVMLWVQGSVSHGISSFHFPPTLQRPMTSCFVTYVACLEKLPSSNTTEKGDPATLRLQIVISYL